MSTKQDGYAFYGIAIITVVAYAFYKYFTRNFDYWKKRNVPFVKPQPVFGNFLDVFTFRKSIANTLWEFYDQFNSPYFGMYILNVPHIVIKDPNIIKSVLVKDFNYFYDRNITSDEKCDSLSSKMLFLAKNPEWKFIRSKMSPVFTSGKIKTMIALMHDAAADLKTYLIKHQAQSSIEAKEVCAKFATNVITSCAFGLNAQSFEDDDAPFRVVGRKMFDYHWKTATRQTCYFVAPSIVKLFKMAFFEPGINDFLRDVFWKTIKEREKTEQKRNDLIDIIKQMKEQSIANDKFSFEGDSVVAQAAQFFAAGFETVSSTMAFTLYELALSPQLQNRLRLEIKSTIAEHGSLTYEAIQSMKYLHMVVSETLRKYPVLPFLDRMCMQNYKIPNSDLVIEKGIPVFISTFGLHYDPKYFPQPEKYDPERFSDENKSKITSFSYIPFGDGPRNCIGERFGLITTKLGLTQILSNFSVEKSDKTRVPLVFSTKGFLLSSIHGIQLKFKEIKAK